MAEEELGNFKIRFETEGAEKTIRSIEDIRAALNRANEGFREISKSAASVGNEINGISSRTKFTPANPSAYSFFGRGGGAEDPSHPTSTAERKVERKAKQENLKDMKKAGSELRGFGRTLSNLNVAGSKLLSNMASIFGKAGSAISAFGEKLGPMGLAFSAVTFTFNKLHDWFQEGAQFADTNLTRRRTAERYGIDMKTLDTFANQYALKSGVDKADEAGWKKARAIGERSYISDVKRFRETWQKWRDEGSNKEYFENLSKYGVLVNPETFSSYESFFKEIMRAVGLTNDIDRKNRLLELAGISEVGQTVAFFSDDFNDDNSWSASHTAGYDKVLYNRPQLERLEKDTASRNADALKRSFNADIRKLENVTDNDFYRGVADDVNASKNWLYEIFGITKSDNGEPLPRRDTKKEIEEYDNQLIGLRKELSGIADGRKKHILLERIREINAKRTALVRTYNKNSGNFDYKEYPLRELTDPLPSINETSNTPGIAPSINSSNNRTMNGDINIIVPGANQQDVINGVRDALNGEYNTTNEFFNTTDLPSNVTNP